VNTNTYVPSFMCVTVFISSSTYKAVKHVDMNSVISIRIFIDFSTYQFEECHIICIVNSINHAKETVMEFIVFFFFHFVKLFVCTCKLEIISVTVSAACCAILITEPMFF